MEVPDAPTLDALRLMIDELMAECTDADLLDLVYKILAQSV